MIQEMCVPQTIELWYNNNIMLDWIELWVLDYQLDNDMLMNSLFYGDQLQQGVVPAMDRTKMRMLLILSVTSTQYRLKTLTVILPPIRWWEYQWNEWCIRWSLDWKLVEWSSILRRWDILNYLFDAVLSS